MSYRVSTTFKTFAAQPAWMDANDIIRIVEVEYTLLPESNFVQSIFDEAKRIVSAKKLCAECGAKNDIDSTFCKKCGKALAAPNQLPRVDLVKGLWWHGNHASESLPRVAPFIHGRLEATFVGEDGRVLGGAIIEDGKYTECRVEMVLVPK